VRITSPDKLLFPADGITKADMAGYYAEIAPAMAPHVRDRPLNLWRWNAGIDGSRVVQQEIPKGAPEWVKRVDVARRGKCGRVCHAVGGEVATLVWLANQNCITPHAWTSRADRPDHPDRLVFDFDPPDEGGGQFEAIRAGALAIGDLLRERGLEPFAMTSGSRGLHVITPLRRDTGWDEARAFADAVGERIAEEDPEHLTTAFRIAKRGGRIYVDTTRNAYAQHGVAPYAVRAKPGAPVATPLHWEELSDSSLAANSWDIRTIGDRLASEGDPWKGMGRSARSLKKPIKLLATL
jgi:bifunctional non-homologous end joining protein LigD